VTNLIRLPPTTTMTAQQALESALVDAESKHLTDVLIMGYDEDGDLYIRSSRLTCAEAPKGVSTCTPALVTPSRARARRYNC
jgi:hypothetical protein